jgi:beta-carotene 3-hydroxylase
MPGWLVNLTAFLVGLVGMEGVAWLTHRYLMHGPLWSWHRSHHEEGKGVFEANDLFAVHFAAVAIGLFAIAAFARWPALSALAAGITAYGALYFLVHDGLVHRRVPLPLRPRKGYLGRLVQAHHLHHLTHTREGAVSFGFLLAHDPEKLAARLKSVRGTTPPKPLAHAPERRFDQQ